MGLRLCTGTTPQVVDSTDSVGEGVLDVGRSPLDERRDERVQAPLAISIRSGGVWVESIVAETAAREGMMASAAESSSCG